MGFLATDLVPTAANGPTPTTPTGRPQLVKVFQVTRADTAANIVKVLLPASASVLNVVRYGGVASDSATSATVTLTFTKDLSTISTASTNVKGNGAVTELLTATNMPNIQPLPLGSDIKLIAQYAEVGASTVGGPWNFVVTYVA